MASITAHLTHLLSLSPLQNPSTDVDWFVLAPYLGGKESLITKQTDTAFGHRDLKIVWEFYAKKPKGAAQGIDLVSFVKRIAEDLGPVQAICELDIERCQTVLLLTPRTSLCRSGVDCVRVSSTDLG
jgi:hypothetical protein